MVRSIWKRALVITLAWPGLAWAQQPIPASGPAAKPAQSSAQYFTVQEAGKTGQKCKILKTWKTADGKTAYQVQSLDSGEMMTIVESGPVRDLPGSRPGSNSRVQAVATRIFHWGSERRPPTGTPVPPNEYVQPMPPGMPRSASARTLTPAHAEPAQPPAMAHPGIPMSPSAARPDSAQPITTPSYLPPASDMRGVPTPTKLPQTSVPQNTNLGSSVGPLKTTAPDNGFSSTPMMQPRTAVQNKPSSTPDKAASTAAPGTPVSRPYSPPSPAVASSASAPNAGTPQRVVQVIPPRSENPSPAPAAAAPKSNSVSAQTAPITPGTATAPPLTEKKPVAVATHASGQATNPLPAQNAAANMAAPVKTLPPMPSMAAPTVPTVPKSPVTNAQPTGFMLPSSDKGSIAATPIRGFDAPKSTPTTLWSNTDTTASKPATVTAAPPTDWRKSWGKADDAKSPSTQKAMQNPADSKPVPARPLLPQAASKGPDPLQMPQEYRLPVEEKPSAQKRDTMVIPAAAATSAPTVKPVLAPVAQSTKAHPPVSSAPIPLGTQSIVQAGDPGPGGVRYLPVPMVTIPDMRRAPVPPMTNGAQVYSAPGNTSTPSDPALANAFTPPSSRQAIAQTTNAFRPLGQSVPTTLSGQVLPAPAAASMVAQGTGSAGINKSANSSVVTTGFQGSARPSQNMPAGYHSTGFQAPPVTALQSPGANVQQMEIALRDSLYPSQREWAAENMATVNWRSHPQVVQSLTAAAKGDPAGSVRATCVRCLASMKVKTGPVVDVVRSLKNDTDPRVRQEAERALSVLGEK